MTQEQRAALMYAQTCLRRIALQLERDLGMDIWRQVVSIASDPTPAVRAQAILLAVGRTGARSGMCNCAVADWR